MAQKPWWRERIRSALASYWVYQHLGNLPAEELAADPDYREVLAAEGDTWPLLVALADRADAETDGTQGSALQLPLGPRHQPLRDDRLAERPDPGRRRAPHARRDRSSAGSRSRCATGRPGPSTTSCSARRCRGCCRTRSATCRASTRSRRPGRAGAAGSGETIRQGGDLEHWQAFRSSFDRLTRMITAAATGAGRAGDHQRALRRRPPQLRRPGRPAGPRRRPGPAVAAAVHQLTCSPVHNVVDWFIQPGFRLGWSRTIARATRLVGRPGRGAAARGDAGTSSPARCSATRSPRWIWTGGTPQVTFLQPRSAGSMTRGRPPGAGRRPARRRRPAGAPPCAHGCNPAVIDRSSPSRVRAARGG